MNRIKINGIKHWGNLSIIAMEPFQGSCFVFASFSKTMVDTSFQSKPNSSLNRGYHTGKSNTQHSQNISPLSDILCRNMRSPFQHHQPDCKTNPCHNTVTPSLYIHLL